MVLRSLISAWLQSAAREAIARAAEPVADGAEAASRLAEEHRPHTWQADVGLLFALRIEAGGLLERLHQRTDLRGAGFQAYRGMVGQVSVAVVVAGPGQQAATRGAQALLSGHRPRWIISAGLAGGLKPGLRRGDLLIADRVGQEAGRTFVLDPPGGLTGETSLAGVRAGKLLSVDRIVTRAAEKLALGERHDAVAVDMETFAVAEVCREAKTPLLAVRVISDPAEEDLPPEVEKLLRQKSGAARAGAALGALARRPSSLRDLWQLKETALVTSERLAEFLIELLAAAGDQHETNADERG